MYYQSDKHTHHVVNNTNPNKNYTQLDLEDVRADYEKGLCPKYVLDFVESRVADNHIDAFELSKRIENVWRESLLQSISSGVMSGKDIRNVKVYIKCDNGEFKQVKNAYSHHGMGVVLET